MPDGAGVPILLGLSCKTHTPLTPEAQLMVSHELVARMLMCVWGVGGARPGPPGGGGLRSFLELHEVGEWHGRSVKCEL